jgi:putative oxidoreductase
MSLLFARLLMSALFIVSGIWHATRFAITVAYFNRIGMPLPEAAAVLTIAVELVGGGLLVLGWRMRWVAGFLIAFVLVATGMGHRFWEADPSRYFGELNNFLKNLAIIGGLLLLGRGKA